MRSSHSLPPTEPPGPGRGGMGAGVWVGVVVVLVSVASSVALFFWLKSQESLSPQAPDAPRVVMRPGGEAAGERSGGEGERLPVAEDLGPGARVKALARAVMTRNGEALRMALAGSVSEEQLAAFLEALHSGALVLDPSQPVSDLGAGDEEVRWAVHVLRPETGERLAMELTLARGAEGAWAVMDAVLPEASGYGAESVEEGDEGEVLSRAEGFLEKLTSGAFSELGAMVDAESVPNEKLAALGILFEEASFSPLTDGSALRATQVTGDRAWVIAKVRSALYGVDSEFGLELRRVGGHWLIERINLSRLMRQFTELASETDAYNPPLVDSPAGGDSLVLYFGYDDDQLTERSFKQLAVVAALLKPSVEKGIRVGGHADALGEDQYNDSLSQRRARRVAEALHSLGVRKSQIQLEAYGERLPLSPNLNPDGTDNPSGRERNRRAEIYLDF